VIDPKILKDSPDLVRQMLVNRKAKVDFDALKAADDARRASQIRADELRSKRNTSAQDFGKLKKAGTADSPEGKALMDSMRGMDAAMAEAVKVQADAEAACHELVMLVPNMPHETTPVGTSGDDNVEVRKWGTPREFDFTAKPHWDICESLGLVDFERASKISGARFSLFMGQGAGSSARSSSSCSTCTSANTGIPRFRSRSSSTPGAWRPRVSFPFWMRTCTKRASPIPCT
jgi:seryl-tRNA synthetase